MQDTVFGSLSQGLLSRTACLAAKEKLTMSFSHWRQKVHREGTIVGSLTLLQAGMPFRALPPFHRGQLWAGLAHSEDPVEGLYASV